MGEKDETIAEEDKKSKQGGGGEGGKKEEVPVDDGGSIVVLKLDLHCDGCAKKVKRSIKNYNGVEEVKVDPAGGKLTVKGNVDANWLRNKVELKTKKKVELVLVPSQTQSHHPNNNKDAAGAGKPKILEKKKNKQPHEDKLVVDDNIIDKIPQDHDKVKDNITQDKVKVIPDDNELIKKRDDNIPPKQLHLQSESSRVVLKIPLHCDGCAQKIRRIIKKIDGVDNVTIDNDKNLVTLEGTMDVKELLPFLKQKLKRSVDIVSPNKDNGGGAPTRGGGEKKGKETGGGGDKKDKAVVGGVGGGGDKKEKATSGDREKKEKTVGGGDVVHIKEKLAEGGGEEKKKEKDGGGGLDEKDKAPGGGDKKDNKQKEVNTNSGGGGGKKEKASGDGDGGGKKEKVGGEMKDIKSDGSQNRLNESKTFNNDGGNKIKNKIDEPKVELNKMEYQRYDAPYTHYGVPMYNQNYANQDYGLIHTMYNNPYHASISYVTEYNHQPEYNHQLYNYQPYHHLQHVQQPQVPPPPPPTYLPPPQDHMFSDENPNACSTM